MQFNEVSDHKAPWDAQGFDSDYNCRNTTIQYNYSHDNDGGLVLICNSGTYHGAGNQGSAVQYNVSINDAIRPRATRSGIFSANIHIAGPCKNTLVQRNLLHVNPKTEPFIVRFMGRLCGLYRVPGKCILRPAGIRNPPEPLHP